MEIIEYSICAFLLSGPVLMVVVLILDAFGVGNVD